MRNDNYLSFKNEQNHYSYPGDLDRIIPALDCVRYEKINLSSIFQLKQPRESVLRKSLIIKRDLNRIFEKILYSGITIITVNLPSCDINYCSRFCRYLEKVKQQQHLKILIDFSFCNSIDISFLGVIVKQFKDKFDNISNLKIVLDSDRSVIAYYQFAKFTTIFETYPDLDTAFLAFENAQEIDFSVGLDKNS